MSREKHVIYKRAPSMGIINRRRNQEIHKRSPMPFGRKSHAEPGLLRPLAPITTNPLIPSFRRPGERGPSPASGISAGAWGKGIMRRVPLQHACAPRAGAAAREGG